MKLPDGIVTWITCGLVFTVLGITAIIDTDWLQVLISILGILVSILGVWNERIRTTRLDNMQQLIDAQARTIQSQRWRMRP